MVELAVRLGARRVEIAHTQYYGWAAKNRGLLMPSREEAEAAIEEVERLKASLAGRSSSTTSLPIITRATRSLHVGMGAAHHECDALRKGAALPCGGADPGLEFWNVTERSLDEIGDDSPGFNAFRGDAWMREPCRSCARKTVDFGGCRCQAFC